MSSRGTYLENGATMKQGEYLHSGNGYYLILQNDHNLVLYKTMHFVPSNAAWSSQTHGKGHGNVRCVMQTDNNLVIYDSRNSPLWASGTHNKGRSGTATCVMQKDGNLVIYDGGRSPLWASNTMQK